MAGRGGAGGCGTEFRGVMGSDKYEGGLNWAALGWMIYPFMRYSYRYTPLCDTHTYWVGCIFSARS